LKVLGIIFDVIGVSVNVIPDLSTHIENAVRLFPDLVIRTVLLNPDSETKTDGCIIGSGEVMIAYTEGIESIERIFKMLNEFEYKNTIMRSFSYLLEWGIA